MSRRINKDTSVVHLVLDRSGSMSSIKEQTISGFNEYLQSLQRDNPSARFSLTIFDDQSIDTIVNNQVARDVQPLNANTYKPRGLTPLYDAIGKVEQMLSEAEGTKKVLVILTDGHENASREFTSSSVKKILANRQEKDNWLVMYLGANQDAFAEGGKIGTNFGNTLNFAPNSIAATMSASYGATARYLKTGSRVEAEFTAQEREEAAA